MAQVVKSLLPRGKPWSWGVSSGLDVEAQFPKPAVLEEGPTGRVLRLTLVLLLDAGSFPREGLVPRQAHPSCLSTHLPFCFRATPYCSTKPWSCPQRLPPRSQMREPSEFPVYTHHPMQLQETDSN